MSFLITSFVPPETSGLFKNRKINNIVPEVPPPCFGPPNEVLAGLAGALFPGFSTLCRPRASAVSSGTRRPVAQKGFPVAWLQGGLVPPAWRSRPPQLTQLGCRDAFTQAESQARPHSGPTTEGGPARDLPSS